LSGTVAVLLVLYNEEKYIEKLAKSLNEQSYNCINIYAIDNNSKDESAKLLKKYIPDAKLIRSNNNNGFAIGNNILAKQAAEDGADYLFVSNTDMILDSECITELVNLTNIDKTLGAAAPMILFGRDDAKTNIIQCYADKADFNTGRTKSLHGSFVYSDNKLPERIEVNTIHGGATFIRTDIYREIGLFNEDNFMYGDELDLAYRLKKTRYKMMVTKKAVAWHFHDWSKKNKKGYYLQYFYMTRNRYLFFHRHNKYISMMKESMKELLKSPLIIRWALKTADIKLAKYYYLGLLHGLLNKKGRTNIRFV